MDTYICLMYHEIGKSAGKTVITKAQFLSQVNFCVANKIRVGSIESIQNSINYQKAGKFSVFTFDDGNKSDLWAAEVLAKNGYTATFFIIKEFSEVNNEKFLNQSEIKLISRMGHSIGVHGKRHTWWSKIDPKTLVEELSETKKWIEDIIDNPCTSCSAPGGKLNDEIINEIYLSKRFDFLRNSKPALNKGKTFQINSIAIKSDNNLSDFEKILRADPLRMKILGIEYNLKKCIKEIIDR